MLWVGVSRAGFTPLSYFWGRRQVRPLCLNGKSVAGRAGRTRKTRCLPFTNTNNPWYSCLKVIFVNSFTPLSFSYLEVARWSLDDTQLPVLGTKHAHTLSGGYFGSSRFPKYKARSSKALQCQNLGWASPSYNQRTPRNQGTPTNNISSALPRCTC